MKIKWSGLGMTDGSGKIGGNVAAKNRFGNYLRRKGQVLNPRTSAQIIVRGIFGAFSSAWRTLTDASRASWNSLAATVTNTDQFGDSFNPTGFNLYKRTNQNLSSIGGTSLADAPALESGPDDIVLTTTTAVIDISDTTIAGVSIQTSNPATNTGGLQPLIMATPPVSAGRSAGSVGNLYRQVIPQGALDWGGPIAAGTTANVNTGDAEWDDLYTAYVNRFGVPPVGTRVFFQIFFTNDATGQKYLTYGFDCIVQA